jgi:glycosyltransferase involved in cell wall biosynthesis
MKIIFDLFNVGLGNNGGSQTLVKSANTLQDIGHEVTIIDKINNQHTWNKLKVPHIKIKNNNNIPEADIIIGTGFKSWNHVLNLPDKFGKKYIWVRGWEIWQASEKEIIQILKNPKLNIIVNSIGLKQYLNNFKIVSKVIRPGHDFKYFFPKRKIKKIKNIVLGGLYHTKHKTKNSHLIVSTYNYLKKHFPGLQLYMFGAEKCHLKIDKYIQQPTLKQKNDFFNQIDIWISPSVSEGLHIVPAEFMLTEGCVIGNNSMLSGTKDYLIHNETGLIARNNFKSIASNVIKLIENSDLRKKLQKNGRQKILDLGNRQVNMKKIIQLFQNDLERKNN